MYRTRNHFVGFSLDQLSPVGPEISLEGRIQFPDPKNIISGAQCVPSWLPVHITIKKDLPVLEVEPAQKRPTCPGS